MSARELPLPLWRQRQDNIKKHTASGYLAYVCRIILGLDLCPISLPHRALRPCASAASGANRAGARNFGVQKIRDAVKAAQRCWMGEFCQPRGYQGKSWNVSVGDKDALELLCCEEKEIKL